MKIENEFRVNMALEEAWEVLTDIPVIAPCMPGAKLTGSEDGVYAGNVKIKVGPVTAEYSGTAEFLSKDDAAHRAELSAKGKDSRGSGNAEALIVAQLVADGDGTKVSIDTDLKVSGKVAQFGKGVMVEVSQKLIGQFVACLEQKIEDMQGTVVDEVAAAGAAGADPAAEPDNDEEVEALDLMDYAGGAVAKRALPLVGAVIMAIVLYFLTRRLKDR